MTERKRNRETERHRDRETKRQKDRETKEQRDSVMEKSVGALVRSKRGLNWEGLKLRG